MAAFRSLLVPLVSAGPTLASTAAAYGVIVAVFQWGWLGPGIGNGATAPVDPWIPLMLFALLFGFSMDYQVFLLSRIREQWLGGASASDAVAGGLADTGRVITSAAAIMICVFAAFGRRPAGAAGHRPGHGRGHLPGRHPGPHGGDARGAAAARPGQLAVPPPAAPRPPGVPVRDPAEITARPFR